MKNMTRRTFLGSAALAYAMPRSALAAPAVLRAESVRLQVLPDGQNATNLLGFNGSSPGPEIRIRQGQPVSLRFENRTESESAIHWHGIRLQNAMDGVPGLTQPVVAPGEDFDYSFTPPDAGTYWYHSHHRSWEQVAQGLYGPLIVEETVPPLVDEDITVVVDDWRLTEDGKLAGGFGNLHDFAHAGRLGNYAMVLPSVETVRQGDRVRLRLINAATARVFPIRLEGITGKIVALDGMALAQPIPLEDMEIAPAQRVDVIGDATGPVQFRFVARDGLYEMGTIATEGENPGPSGGPIAALPAPDIAPLPSATDRELTLTMEGGAMSGGHGGTDIWAFNGVSGLPDDPYAAFAPGETATINLVNRTRFPHGIHLHGHHFFEIGPDGNTGHLRDTSLVAAGASRRIAVRFDNPGKWLLHCHMLGHQASGMKTWVSVG